MPARYRSDRFVGRAREISRLAVALEAAAEGQSRRLLIAGPGGVGVSRLIDESILRVGRLSEPFAVLRWRAWAGRTREPYAPVIAGLRAYLSGLEAGERARILGPGADAIATLAPDLGGTPPAPRALRVGEDRRAAWVAEAVMRTLERIGERRPVLLALEDLHLADAATRALAVFLARVSRPSRVCTIATYGTDNLVRGDPFLADVAAIAEIADPPDRLELGPLGPDELADLVAGIEGERPTAALLLLVAERSGGNPLLVEEVLAARRELSGVSLGSSLGELVAARLALPVAVGIPVSGQATVEGSVRPVGPRRAGVSLGVGGLPQPQLQRRGHANREEAPLEQLESPEIPRRRPLRLRPEPLGQPRRALTQCDEPLTGGKGGGGDHLERT